MKKLIPFSFIKYFNVFGKNYSVKQMYLIVIYCSEIIVLKEVSLKEISNMVITALVTLYIHIYLTVNFHRQIHFMLCYEKYNISFSIF